MDSVLWMSLLWLTFGAIHLGATSERPRAALVARYGERGFTNRFSLVAALLFSAVVGYYATHRAEGAEFLGLSVYPALRWLAITAIVSGAALMAGALADYADSPMALTGGGVREPRGLDRVSRHPFFAGLVLFSLAHVLLATQLVGFVFFSGFAVVSIVGAHHQDRKLAARKPGYAGFAQATSALPFAAILAGRQRLVARELPWLGLAIGVGAAVGLRFVHAGILDHGGIYFIGATLAGVSLLLVQDWRREHARTHRGAGRDAAHG